MIYVALTALFIVAAGLFVMYVTRTTKEQLPNTQENYVEILQREVVDLLPTAADLALYSVEMAHARHVLDEARDTDEFLESLEILAKGLSGYYQSLGDLKSLLRDEKALENLSKLF